MRFLHACVVPISPTGSLWTVGVILFILCFSFLNIIIIHLLKLLHFTEIRKVVVYYTRKKIDTTYRKVVFFAGS